MYIHVYIKDGCPMNLVFLQIVARERLKINDMAVLAQQQRKVPSFSVLYLIRRG